MSLPNDLLELFTSESNKLENLVNALNFDAELPVNQIVEVYYQITNLSSMITVVKPQIDQNNDKVLSTEKLSLKIQFYNTSKNNGTYCNFNI